MKNNPNDLQIGFGNYIGYEKIDNGLRILTDKNKVELTVYTSQIIRVRTINEDEPVKDFSYAVIALPEYRQFAIAETSDAITISTPNLKVIIRKHPLNIGFYTPPDEVLNLDDPLVIFRIGNQITAYKKLQEGERFIGLGEKTGGLNRRGSAYTMWNTDYFSYGINADPLYMSVPFYIGMHHEKSYGIFFDNTFKGKFDFAASNDRFVSFSAEGGELNYYFIGGANVSEIIANYSWLTGRMEMPPLWSLGFQQCRYSYYPDHKVMNVARSFREKKIPADVIYLDIHYMDNYKVFTFDETKFPDPDKMVVDLQDMGFESVVILDPGIKVEEGYLPYDQGVSSDYFLKYPDDTNYSGQVWPGWSHFPDFTNPEVRAWWGDQLKFYTNKGIKGYWNDMNEPSTWGQSMPDLVKFEHEGEGGHSLKSHNVYGMQMCRSTSEGFKKNVSDMRPFVLNRAGYAGIQRYGASWTGDNVASDEHMLCGIRLVNSLGISGVPFSGFDVGGFAGEPGAELFARWISVGAFTPLFRCHSMINTKDSEPWSFGEEVEEISRSYINLRYRLLPYIYSAFYQASQSGMPVSRSLAIAHSHDDIVYEAEFQNQYYFGDSFMVIPAVSNKEIIRAYLPTGEWYDMHTGGKVNAGKEFVFSRKERLPVFIKASSIIPMQSIVQSTKERPNGILEIHVYRGSEENEFCYYEDDGTTYQYQKGFFYKRTISYSPNKKQIIFTDAEGSYVSIFHSIKLYLHSFDDNAVYHVNRSKTKTATEDYQFIPPVTCFDPFYKEQPTDMIEKKVPFIEFKNDIHEIIIQW